MALYKVIVAYDGSRFSGFQRQITPRTVQGEIEKTLRTIGWRGKSILFAGRTDAGVHSEGQVIAFQLDWVHTESDLIKALNSCLPEDISVAQAEVVKSDFHPRFDAKKRIYRYQLYQGFFRNCLLDRYYWRIWPKMDMKKVNRASKIILGTHNFNNFGNPPNDRSTTVRTVKQAEWKKLDSGAIHFHIAAEAFLYHMVRRIVFLMVKIGQGNVLEDDISAALRQENNLPDGLAPANGLFLEKIEY